MMFRKKIFLFAVLALAFAAKAQQLKINELFNEGMVLQQKSKVLVWGTAIPSKEISINIQQKEFKGKANPDGKWEIALNNLQPGGPFTFSVISEGDTIKLKEVYVGEVWIAGGQSNMAWTLEKTNGGSEEIATASNKNIRFVLVPTLTYDGDRTRGDMNWHTATTENVSQLSGVAYFFAKSLQQKLGVPVGLICCYKGGTAAEVWMNRETLMQQKKHIPIVTNYENYQILLGKEKYDQLYNTYETKLKVYFDSIKSGFANATRPEEPMGEKHYKRPFGLYNTMFKRIIPYSAQGVIWYQGEANAPRSEQYQTLFPALINEWRKDFKNPQMPFYFVQLANYDHPAYGNRPMWAELREAQLLTWQKVKNTGMAVSLDAGEKNTIHPTNKKPVGERLAAIAFHETYKQPVPYSGPVFKSVKFESNKAVLTFDFVYDGLIANGELKGFTICGEDQKFVPAKAEIINNQIIVSSTNVSKPIAVRYGWANWTNANLTNKAGFPASPFRTDNFTLLSHDVLTPNY
ncbi:MAG: sialate O-acetylesterase [Paludibacter sp.]